MLAVLWRIGILIVGHLVQRDTTLIGIISWTYSSDGLFDNKTSLIIGIFLSDSGIIDLTSNASWINRMFLYHVVQYSIIVSLDNCSMVVVSHLLLMLLVHDTSKIWIIFRSDELGLNTICYGLVAVISNASSVLNTIRGNTSDTTWIDISSAIHHVKSTW